MLAKSVSESGILKSEQENDLQQMSAEKTPDSSIPFIDDGDVPEEGQKSTQRQYNLTITRNYQNKTRRVEISKILQDVDSMNQRSLSPVAPLAKDSENLTDDEQDKRETLNAAEFELTIRSDNSIIRIQGFDNKSAISFDSGRGTGDNVYDFLSKEVNKIFRKPERQEIEKAMRSLTNGDVSTSSEERVRPQNNWKVLKKSLMNMRSGKSAEEQRRGSIERYPKMVLLQDTKPPSEKDGYPKMVMFDETKAKKNNKPRMPKKSTSEDEEESESDGNVGKKGMEEICIELEKHPVKEEMMEKEPEAPQKKKKQLHQLQLNNTRGCFCQGCKSFAMSPFKVSTNHQDLCFFNTSESDESGQASSPTYRHYPGHYCPSMYIPVYDRQIPYYHYNPGGFHCGGRLQDTATQTAEVDLGPYCEEAEEPKDLPFSFLSSFLPRIVVMKSFQEQVPGEDAETKISELPKSESSISTPQNEKEDEKECGKLELEDEEVEELPFTEDLQEKEEDQGKQEDNLQILNDSSEEIAETATDELLQVTNDELPLTKIGYRIYDKVNELVMERKEKEAKGEVTQETQNERNPSPRSITFQFKNRLVNFQLRGNDYDSNSYFKIRESGAGEEDTYRKCVTPDKMLVTKSELWHPTNGGKIRNGETSGKIIDAVSFSVSENDKIVFRIEMGEGESERKTKEAKVGTDGFDVIGGDFIQQEGIDKKELSPRTAEVLKLLKHKLEAVEGIKKQNRRSQDLKFPGVFLIQPIDSRRGFPSDDYLMTKERKWRKSKEVLGKAREYYCEDCLATMRVLEDEKPSVKNIVDKFETIIHLGSY